MQVRMHIPRVSPQVHRTPTSCVFPWSLSLVGIFALTCETYFDSKLIHRRDIRVPPVQEIFQLLFCYVSRSFLFNNIVYRLTRHIRFMFGAQRAVGNVFGG